MAFNLWYILAVGAGGFIGAVARFLLSISVDEYFESSSFPYGIFLTNIIGCLLIGLLAGIFEGKAWVHSELRLFVFTGLLGGFTTFSTFINDSFLLGKEGAFGLALLNVAGQVLIGLLFVWFGYLLAKLFS